MDGSSASAFSPAHCLPGGLAEGTDTAVSPKCLLGIPNPDLAALSTPPGYQAYTMVRRVGSLFPHTPTSLERPAAPEPPSSTARPAYIDFTIKSQR